MQTDPLHRLPTVATFFAHINPKLPLIKAPQTKYNTKNQLLSLKALLLYAKRPLFKRTHLRTPHSALLPRACSHWRAVAGVFTSHPVQGGRGDLTAQRLFASKKQRYHTTQTWVFQAVKAIYRIKGKKHPKTTAWPWVKSFVQE